MLFVAMALTVGIVDVARAVWTFNTLGYAARDASRYASVRSRSSGDEATVAKLRARVLERAPALHDSRLTVNATWTPTNAAGSVVRVSLTYAFDPVTPFVPGSALTLQTSSRMVVSN